MESCRIIREICETNKKGVSKQHKINRVVATYFHLFSVEITGYLHAIQDNERIIKINMTA